MVILAGLQAKLDRWWKWSDCGMDGLIWKMIVSLKKLLSWDKSLCKRNWSYEIKVIFK